MPMILIVDDEPDIIKLISRYAAREGYEVTSAEDGGKAIEMCAAQDFDLIVMDVMMPDTDGFTACKKIKEFKDIPVIMLSARGTEFDKLFGFEVGVDDYVTKPFSPLELMARIKAVMNRHNTYVPKDAASGAGAGNSHMPKGVDDNGVISTAGIEIDTLGMTVTVDGKCKELTAKEFALLMLFMNNRGIVPTRDRILNEVWGYDSFGVDRTVDWQIKLLRNKLGSARDCIKTVRGVGYKFEA